MLKTRHNDRIHPPAAGDAIVMQEAEMNESIHRMTDPGSPPSDSAVADWMGKKAYAYWKQVTHLIEQSYPNIFTPEWLFGGKKHGWSLRYKRANPSVR